MTPILIPFILSLSKDEQKISEKNQNGASGSFVTRRLSARVRQIGASERGAALVTVLLAVALLMVAVVEFTYSAQVDHHLTHNGLKTLQAAYLARSGINLAMLVLKKDTRNSAIDSLKDDWARALPPLPAGEGIVMVRVSDEQGKLNLNVLRTNNGAINGRWREVAERLFELRGLDPGLLDPLLDWLDGDDFPEPRGAESSHYLGLTPPYSARNGPLFTLGELGRVEGFTSVVRARLDGVITVVPANNTKVNANTAPLEVLAALFPLVDPQALDQFIRSREETPVRGPSELHERLGIDPRLPVETLNLIDVRSEFFAIYALATVAPISQGLTVIVQRRASAVTPVYWNPALLTAASAGEA